VARITVTLSFSSRLTLFGEVEGLIIFLTQVGGAPSPASKLYFMAGVRCPEVEGERSKCEIYFAPLCDRLLLGWW